MQKLFLDGKMTFFEQIMDTEGKFKQVFNSPVLMRNRENFGTYDSIKASNQ